MKNVVYFKVLSVLSLAGSIIAHLISLKWNIAEIGYFLILHITTMVSFIGAFFYIYKDVKGRRGNKAKGLWLVNYVKHVIGFVKSMYRAARLQPMHFISCVCFVVLYFPLMQYVVGSFEEQFNLSRYSEGEEDILKMVSGHWIIFSYISFIYFWSIMPLQIKIRVSEPRIPEC
ncbi:MAG: hypothetical protein ACI978_002750 [Oleispira sp.]|jgi:hypothetical protein